MVNTAIADSKIHQKISLDEWATEPPSGGQEWIDGNLIEKTGMTIQHGRLQESRKIYAADEVMTSLVFDGFSITVNHLLG